MRYRRNLKKFLGESMYSLKGMEKAPLQKVGNPCREISIGKFLEGFSEGSSGREIGW
jgi:hypothetical protein